VLMALAPQLSGPLLAQALAGAQVTWDEGERARVLIALAPQLSVPLLVQALAAAQAISDERVRARVLSVLALELREENRTEIFRSLYHSITMVLRRLHTEDRYAVLHYI